VIVTAASDDHPLRAKTSRTTKTISSKGRIRHLTTCLPVFVFL